MSTLFADGKWGQFANSLESLDKLLLLQLQLNAT